MERKEHFFRWRNLLIGLVAILALGGVYCILARQGLGIPCIFYTVTGLRCPGCGNSRAALALLRLDVKAALGYNMLFPLEFFYIVWVLFWCSRAYLRGGKFSYKPRWPWIDLGILVLVVLWGVVRNLI